MQEVFSNGGTVKATYRKAKGEREGRSERFDARITPAQKELLTRAASLEEESMSHFVFRVALRAAKRRLLEEESMTLTQRDRALLVDALVNPPAPNPALRAAFDRYRRDFAR